MTAPNSIHRMTRQRRAIMRALSDAGRPLAPGEVHALAVEEVPNLGLSTVYRTLRALAEQGEIVPVTLPGEPDRYETTARASRHHHHFRCDDCRRVFDVDGCPRGLDHLVPEGFTMTDHTIVLRGRCAECA